MRTDRCVLGGDVAAIIFGVDGVVLDTARPAAAAWKSVLDPFLRSHTTGREAGFRPFEVRADYLRYFHGRPRSGGVREFLASRGPAPPAEIVLDLVERQERLFLTEVRRHGIAPFASTVDLVRAARRHRLRTAAISVDRYAAELLTRAGVADMFDVRLDGLDAPGTGLPGHLEPCLLIEAALRMRTPPTRTAVIEQSPDGVAAGRHGGFGLVVGVDRVGRGAELRAYGADVVIEDLAQVTLLRAPALIGRH
ncbi:HAD family hydrolase [Actinoallomurus soli]|uniref:HAD family hydrolase n=1 Tax=Actinoallomurus soli TaxID=2952535 RepID=UPI0020926759|nr:HAD family hydrolase [Actinoallomurus soli]MCO5967788.1 hydrolase [Actinoallomurus soli]